MITVLKILVAMVSVVITLFIILAFQGVMDFLAQVAEIELGKDSLITIILQFGIFISIALGIYIGKKSYILFSTKPNFYPLKKTAIIFLIKLVIAVVVFVISVASITVYLYSLNLPSDLHTRMLTNITAKLFFLSLVFSFVIKPNMFDKVIIDNER